jgi:hypothetical protein
MFCMSCGCGWTVLVGDHVPQSHCCTEVGIGVAFGGGIVLNLVDSILPGAVSTTDIAPLRSVNKRSLDF